jgi:2-polyprenyl-3-methyl-5-hydroxy-6-metoxy-1,4-benzoquinol methylase
MSDKKIIVDEIKFHSVESCPLCGSQGDILFMNLTDRLYKSPGKWNLRKCKNQSCSLLWLDPRPNLDEVWKVYNNYYTHSDSSASLLYRFSRWIEEGYYSWAYGYKLNVSVLQKLAGALIYILPTEKAEYDFNIMELDKKETGKILDVGCGNGFFISILKNRGWDVEGLETDLKAVEFCKSQGLNAKHGDLHTQNYPDNTFDAVALAHVIEHVYDPVNLVKEIYRILKPGGQIILATPNSKSWMFNEKFNSNWFSLHSPGHVQIFNRKNLCSLLESYGFKITTSKTSARNEWYVYLGSRSIEETGNFGMGVERHNKWHIILGKVFQLITWIKLHFNKDSGGELFIKAVK